MTSECPIYLPNEGECVLVSYELAGSPILPAVRTYRKIFDSDRAILLHLDLSVVKEEIFLPGTCYLLNLLDRVGGISDFIPSTAALEKAEAPFFSLAEVTKPDNEPPVLRTIGSDNGSNTSIHSFTFAGSRDTSSPKDRENSRIQAMKAEKYTRKLTRLFLAPKFFGSGLIVSKYPNRRIAYFAGKFASDLLEFKSTVQSLKIAANVTSATTPPSDAPPPCNHSDGAETAPMTSANSTEGDIKHRATATHSQHHGDRVEFDDVRDDDAGVLARDLAVAHQADEERVLAGVVQFPASQTARSVHHHHLQRNEASLMFSHTTADTRRPGMLDASARMDHPGPSPVQQQHRDQRAELEEARNDIAEVLSRSLARTHQMGAKRNVTRAVQISASQTALSGHHHHHHNHPLRDEPSHMSSRTTTIDMRRAGTGRTDNSSRHHTTTPAHSQHHGHRVEFEEGALARDLEVAQRADEERVFARVVQIPASQTALSGHHHHQRVEPSHMSSRTTTIDMRRAGTGRTDNSSRHHTTTPAHSQHHGHRVEFEEGALARDLEVVQRADEERVFSRVVQIPASQTAHPGHHHHHHHNHHQRDEPSHMSSRTTTIDMRRAEMLDASALSTAQQQHRDQRAEFRDAREPAVDRFVQFSASQSARSGHHHQMPSRTTKFM